MAVAVHVRVGVVRSVAEEVKSVLPAVASEDSIEQEDADDDAVSYEFIRKDGLEEKGCEDEEDNLREGNKVELFEV